MWLASMARVKQHEARKTCGLFSPMLPEQRKDAEEFEALRLNGEAGLPLHVSGGCLGRRLPRLHSADRVAAECSAPGNNRQLVVKPRMNFSASEQPWTMGSRQ